jgi:hypothetical protein
MRAKPGITKGREESLSQNLTVADIVKKFTDPLGILDWLRARWSGDRIPVGARFSAPVQTGPGAYSVSCTMGTGSFPGVKSGRGVTLTPHTLLVSLVIKE